MSIVAGYYYKSIPKHLRPFYMSLSPDRKRDYRSCVEYLSSLSFSRYPTDDELLRLVQDFMKAEQIDLEDAIASSRSCSNC